MTIEEAFEIVLDLALQNVIDPKDDPDFAEESVRQHEALDQVHDFVLNNVLR
jgi:hypothetical protein